MEHNLIESIGEFLVMVVWLLILGILSISTIVAIWYLCISSIDRAVQRRKKWYHIPLTDMGKYLLLKRCREVYSKYKGNHCLTEEFSESMFDEALYSKYYAKKDIMRVSRMLKNKTLVNKYFSGNFGPQEYYLFYKEYTEDIEIDLVGIAELMPEQVKESIVFEKCIYLLIKEGILDAECKPVKDNHKNTTYFYVLADTVWEFCLQYDSNLKNRDIVFASLWSEDKSPKGIEKYGSNLRSGLSDAKNSKNETIRDKYETNKAEILKIINSARPTNK